MTNKPNPYTLITWESYLSDLEFE